MVFNQGLLYRFYQSNFVFDTIVKAVYTCKLQYYTYYLMLVMSALWDLWHEGCGLVAWYSTWLHLMLYQPIDHTPCAIHVKHELTNIKWFIVSPWPTSTCVLTFNGVCWRFLLILHGQVNMTQTARVRLRDLWVGWCLWCCPRSNNEWS